MPPIVGHHQGPGHPWLVPSEAHCLGGTHWGEVRYPPHTLDMYPSAREVTAP